MAGEDIVEGQVAQCRAGPDRDLRVVDLGEVPQKFFAGGGRLEAFQVFWCCPLCVTRDSQNRKYIGR